MIQPHVSVIIPTYNQAAFIGKAIQSVLQQNTQDWELIVVDDGSTDNVDEVVAQFADPRIRFVRQTNMGVGGARNTGILHSTGKYLAFLDADDYFHPEKLTVQVRHLDENPEIGLSYAGRIEVDADGDPIWMLRPPAEAGLRELVLGFPFTVNDLVMRREWVSQSGVFDKTFALHSEDRDFYLRLALNNCRFARVNRFLAYRRIHTRRVYQRIPDRITLMYRALDTAFEDPRLPMEVLSLRDQARSKVLLFWVVQEFIQDEPAPACEHLREVVRLNPAILQPDPANGMARFLNYVVWFSVRDGGEHGELIKKVFDKLPEDLAALKQARNWALAHGYIFRGARDLLWARSTQGQAHIEQAVRLAGRLDPWLVGSITDQLSAYGLEFGGKMLRQAYARLAPALSRVGTQNQLRQIQSSLSMNQAFADYRRGRFDQVPEDLIRAVLLDPGRVMDRGVLSILTRSLLGKLKKAAS